MAKLPKDRGTNPADIFSMVAGALVLLLLMASPAVSLDFLLDSFSNSSFLLVGDAQISSSRLVLTSNSNQFSIGRAFYPSRLQIAPNGTSFSTSFIFSIVPGDPTTPGFGLAFVLSNTTEPPNALSGQYFGLFSNSTKRIPFPLLAVEFDTGRNPEFGEPDGNHIGVDLNYIESSIINSAGYYLDSGEFRPIDMRSGINIRAWIDFDLPTSQIQVTIAPIDLARKPDKPLINYTDPEIRSYLSPTMYIGFSASKVTWVEEQRILAWSFSDTGSPARELNTTNLPTFTNPTAASNSSLPPSAIAGVVVAAFVLLLLCIGAVLLKKRWKRSDLSGEEEPPEGWEMEFWPRRFSYLDLSNATGGFSQGNLLGYGGFGKVYKGVLPEGDEIAVKCVSQDSKQGMREFMAEISSMGRMQHRSLIHMKGWCRRGHELMLVYDYMPNGSLARWIFPKGGDRKGPLLGWPERKQVMVDVAEGLLYLHDGWEKVVLHRDVKPSNILLDGEMRGRIGDFGLAKLYGHGEAVGSTRVVGTLGYLAPELARVAAPTKKSDVYSFGVVVLQTCSGRKAIELGDGNEEDFVLVDWVRKMYVEGKIREVLAVAGDGDGGGGVEEAAEEMELAVKLGLACCHPDPELRPNMKEVVEILFGSKLEAQGR